MRALVCEAYGPIENLKIARCSANGMPRRARCCCASARPASASPPCWGAGQAPEQAAPALRSRQRDGRPHRQAGRRRHRSVGRPADSDRGEPGRLCRIRRGDGGECRADPRDHALCASDKLPNAVSDGVRRAEMEGRHAARRGVTGAWRRRRFGPDGREVGKAMGAKRSPGRRRRASSRPPPRKQEPII